MHTHNIMCAHYLPCSYHVEGSVSYTSEHSENLENFNVNKGGRER